MNLESSFFRSMSLDEDLATPRRFEHFRPTRRNVDILRAVANPGATMVIAPYGSGKSLAAGVAALVVRGDEADRAVTSALTPKIAEVDAELGKSMALRLAEPERGAVVVLSGFVSDPLDVVATRLGLPDWPRTVESLGRALSGRGWSHVSIVWDEFGRHLEGLVAEGRAGELDVVQRLAERASRSRSPTVSLTLLLHQNLLAYASRLNETTRSEWRKVEGRFAQLSIVEDSREAYRLVADVVAAMRPKASRPARASKVLAERVVAAKWLDGMSEVAEVAALLSSAAPLSPGALQVLPALVARVGQNERSLFSFLREADLSALVDVETVYQAFSDAMRTDVGIGGTYRRWLETESARSRAASPLQRQILAAACLLQLGISGERRRLPRAVLELAVGDGGGRGVAAEVDTLIEHKLLLWRRHNDDVAVWHGADVNVALRVREERDRRSTGFDVTAFLEERFAAPYVRASRHNARFGVNRFLEGRYQMVAEAVAGATAEIGSRGGAVIYLIARDRGEIERARSFVAACTAERTVHVVPDRTVDLAGAAIEVLALESLRGDADFLASDPMVTTELDELMSVAFEQLATILRGLLDPRASASGWYARGKRLTVSADRPASVAASTLFDEWYPMTPRIANDQLMRDQASRSMTTARVRVVGAILGQDDKERLGFDADDRGAEASIYRTVLENTGLHLPGERRFAEAKEIRDGGLAAAWAVVARFFRGASEPGPGKPLAALLSELAGPPIGLPRAVTPLVVAAGYRQFARTVAIYRDGAYVGEQLGFQFDQMVSHPEGYVVRVAKWEPRLVDYLNELCYAFIHRRPGANEELVSAAVDAMSRWTSTVPDGSRRAARIDGPARALLQVAFSQHDPFDKVLVHLPQAFGLEGPHRKVVGYVERARKEIDALQDAYAAAAVATAADLFRAGSAGDGLIEAVSAWASCFASSSLEGRADLRISDKAVLRRAVETANGRFSPKSFVGSLSSILLQRGLDKWDDRSDAQFRTALRECQARIEAAALDTSDPSPELRPIVAARISELGAMLERIDAADLSRRAVEVSSIRTKR